MKNLLLIALFFTQLSFGITNNKVWRIPSGGSSPTWGAVNLSDNTNAVTGVLPKANLAASGIQSSAAATSSTASASYVDVTGVSVSITTIGRPVFCFLTGNSTGGGADGYIHVQGGTIPTAQLRFMRDSTGLSEYKLRVNGVASGGSTTIPSSSLLLLDVPSAGVHTYKLQQKLLSGTLVETGNSHINCVEL